MTEVNYSALKKPAQIMSVLFHPVFLPTLFSVLLLKSYRFSFFTIPPKLELLLLATIFVNTCLLPLFLTLLMKRFGLISGFQMDSRADRSGPFAFSTVLYFFSWYLVYKASLPIALESMLLGASFTLLLLYIVNIRYKISAHMAGVGGICGAFFSLGVFYAVPVTDVLIVTLVVAGLLASARLILSAHSPSEIYAGFFLGFVSQYFSHYF